MKRINKKGFTLVELIAIIVILIVIMLVAITNIRNHTQEAKEKALTANAISYIKSANILSTNLRGSSEEIISARLTVEDLENLGVKLSGELPTNGYVVYKDSEVTCACLEYKKSNVTYTNEKYTPKIKGKCSKENICLDESSLSKSFTYKGEGETYTVLKNGTYKIELWGAQGGTGNLIAPGGYTSGNIYLTKGEKLYFFVGQSANARATAFNGGGGCYDSCYGGGGATDVRLVNGSWNEVKSLKSRIMVAAGGAGYNAWRSGYIGGYGGGLTGGNGAGDSTRYGATQTAGGAGTASSRNGTFGVGGYGDNYGGGGGGGYWGGAGGHNSGTGNGGSGGSSYISGHTGCVAIASADSLTPKEGCETGTNDNSCSIHYSEKVFTNTVIKAGNEEMPDYSTGGSFVGNLGNGHAKITYLGSSDEDTSRDEKNFYDLFSGYNRLEYIESDGSTYIETDLIPSAKTGFEAKFKSYNVYENSNTYYIFGSKSSDSYRYMLGTHLNSSVPAVFLGLVSSSYNYNQNLSDVVTVKKLNNSMIINEDVRGYVNTSANTITKPITVFALNNNGTIQEYATARLYDLTFYNGGKKSSHFIPCEKTPENKIGLCETFSGKFFTSKGTGALTKGPVVNE